MKPWPFEDFTWDWLKNQLYVIASGPLAPKINVTTVRIHWADCNKKLGMTSRDIDPAETLRRSIMVSFKV